MARRLLISILNQNFSSAKLCFSCLKTSCSLLILLLLSSVVFSFDYEIVRNHDGQFGNVVSIYVNNREIFSVLGDDTEAFKRAYGFVAHVIDCGQLRYKEGDMCVVRANNNFAIQWNDQRLVVFSDKERLLNDARANTLERIKGFGVAVSHQDDGSPVRLPEKVAGYKKINQIKEVPIATAKTWKYFPAVHAFLPVGTKMRVLNPAKDWSIVVQVVKNENLGMDNTLGLTARAMSALGVDSQKESAVKTQFL